ncbi:hypothetical protein B0533_02240 [Sedimentibacter sp. SX930]|nr:hypothetical protein B0533_02240 [Sedimentibacter sp. SX930]
MKLVERTVAPGRLGLDGAEKTTVVRPPTNGGSPEEQLIPSPQLRPIFASSELGTLRSLEIG